MPIIKNIGKRDRMVADRILHPGDAKYISQKQAEQFDGIADFEIVDETPVQTKPVVDSEPKFLSAPVNASTAASTPPLTKGHDVSAKGKKSRGKKK